MDKLTYKNWLYGSAQLLSYGTQKKVSYGVMSIKNQ
jgi:hypothetical protein